MKKWWIVLIAVLAIAAAAVVGYMLSTAPRGVESLQATQPETAAPTEPATERPTEPPTEAPTEPPMEAGETLVLNGTELVTAISDGTEYVSADALQQAGIPLPEAEPLQNGGTDYYVLSAVSEENRCAEYVDDETGPLLSDARCGALFHRAERERAGAHVPCCQRQYVGH